jgi:hypothetical protein
MSDPRTLNLATISNPTIIFIILIIIFKSNSWLFLNIDNIYFQIY